MPDERELMTKKSFLNSDLGLVDRKVGDHHADDYQYGYRNPD